jgi:hypothetical protein
VATAPRSSHVSTTQRSESASCKWISPETCRAARRAARRASAPRPVRHGGGVGLRCLSRRPQRARGGAGARGRGGAGARGRGGAGARGRGSALSSPPKSFCESFFSARGCHARCKLRGQLRAAASGLREHSAPRTKPRGARARARAGGAARVHLERKPLVERACLGDGAERDERLPRAPRGWGGRWSTLRAGRGAAAQRATRRRDTGPATCPRKSELPTRSWSNTSTLRRPPRRALSARAGLRAPCRKRKSFSFSFSQWALVRVSRLGSGTWMTRGRARGRGAGRRRT